MEFEVHIRGLGGESRISRWDAAAIKRLTGDDLTNMTNVIELVGKRSAVAQGLGAPVTDIWRIRSTDQRLYLYAMRRSHGTLVLGAIKVGAKKLFVRTADGKLFELEAQCVLDFYVHESCQRQGIGKALFEHMLAVEGQEPAGMAYDRPSPKLMGFLRKYYGLWKFVPQSNNYVLFDDYFEKKPLVPMARGQLPGVAGKAGAQPSAWQLKQQQQQQQQQQPYQQIKSGGSGSIASPAADSHDGGFDAWGQQDQGPPTAAVGSQHGARGSMQPGPRPASKSGYLAPDLMSPSAGVGSYLRPPSSSSQQGQLPGSYSQMQQQQQYYQPPSQRGQQAMTSQSILEQQYHRDQQQQQYQYAAEGGGYVGTGLRTSISVQMPMAGQGGPWAGSGPGEAPSPSRQQQQQQQQQEQQQQQQGTRPSSGSMGARWAASNRGAAGIGGGTPGPSGRGISEGPGGQTGRAGGALLPGRGQDSLDAFSGGARQGRNQQALDMMPAPGGSMGNVGGGSGYSRPPPWALHEDQQQQQQQQQGSGYGPLHYPQAPQRGPSGMVSPSPAAAAGGTWQAAPSPSYSSTPQSRTPAGAGSTWPQQPGGAFSPYGPAGSPSVSARVAAMQQRSGTGAAGCMAW